MGFEPTVSTLGRSRVATTPCPRELILLFTVGETYGSVKLLCYFTPPNSIAAPGVFVCLFDDGRKQEMGYTDS